MTKTPAQEHTNSEHCFSRQDWIERELRLPSREKVRVYILARELDIDTGDLLRLCQQAGYDVKNQLSNLDPDQQKHLEEIVKKGSKAPAAPTPVKPVTKVVAPDEKAVPIISAPRAPKREVEAPRAPEPVVELPPVEEPAPPVLAAVIDAPAGPAKSAARCSETGCRICPRRRPRQQPSRRQPLFLLRLPCPQPRLRKRNRPRQPRHRRRPASHRPFSRPGCRKTWADRSRPSPPRTAAAPHGPVPRPRAGPTSRAARLLRRPIWPT